MDFLQKIWYNLGRKAGLLRLYNREQKRVPTAGAESQRHCERVKAMYNFRKGYYSDVRIEDRFNNTLVFLDKKLQQVLDRTEKRAFIRVFNGKMWYYSSVTDVAHVQQELDALYDVAEPNPDIDENPIVKRFEVNKADVRKFNGNSSVRKVSLDEKRRFTEKYVDVAAEGKYTVMSQVIYMDKNYDFTFYSSKGAEIRHDFQVAGLVFVMELSNGENKETSFGYSTALDFQGIGDPAEKIRESYKESEDFLLNSVPCEKGDFPVILAPKVAGVFAHESFGHKSEADFMVGDETMKKEWTLGKQIASPKLSIIDTGLMDGSGYVPFDDDGTAAKKTYLIEKGVLKGRLHSAVTADILEEGLTGNSRALNCTFEPIVRMTTTYIEGGDSTFEELVGKIKFGYFIKSYKHGSGMSTFTIAPNKAYEIKDGKITRPVRISVISGNVFETLGLIDGLGKDVEIEVDVAGGCGKMEQGPLPVGLGGPYVSISRMSVK